MPTNAHDSNKIPRLLLVDSSGKLVLGPSTEVIGSVNEARGKTIIYDDAGIANGTATIHTVTAGKTFYILQIGLTYDADDLSKRSNIEINPGGKLLLQAFSRTTATYNTQDSNTITVAYPHPIPVAAGLTIDVRSYAGTVDSFGWVLGWEE